VVLRANSAVINSVDRQERRDTAERQSEQVQRNRAKDRGITADEFYAGERLSGVAASFAGVGARMRIVPMSSAARTKP
jgi:hypothetical protein